MRLEQLPPTISVERAAQILGVSRSSAYRAAKIGEIPTFKIGRRLLVPTARLMAMLSVEPTSRQPDGVTSAIVS